MAITAFECVVGAAPGKGVGAGQAEQVNRLDGVAGVEGVEAGGAGELEAADLATVGVVALGEQRGGVAVVVVDGEAAVIGDHDFRIALRAGGIGVDADRLWRGSDAGGVVYPREHVALRRIGLRPCDHEAAGGQRRYTDLVLSEGGVAAGDEFGCKQRRGRRRVGYDLREQVIVAAVVNLPDHRERAAAERVRGDRDCFRVVGVGQAAVGVAIGKVERRAGGHAAYVEALGADPVVRARRRAAAGGNENRDGAERDPAAVGQHRRRLEVAGGGEPVRHQAACGAVAQHVVLVVGDAVVGLVGDRESAVGKAGDVRLDAIGADLQGGKRAARRGAARVEQLHLERVHQRQRAAAVGFDILGPHQRAAGRKARQLNGVAVDVAVAGGAYHGIRHDELCGAGDAGAVGDLGENPVAADARCISIPGAEDAAVLKHHPRAGVVHVLGVLGVERDFRTDRRKRAERDDAIVEADALDALQGVGVVAAGRHGSMAHRDGAARVHAEHVFGHVVGEQRAVGSGAAEQGVVAAVALQLVVGQIADDHVGDGIAGAVEADAGNAVEEHQALDLGFRQLVVHRGRAHFVGATTTAFDDGVGSRIVRADEVDVVAGATFQAVGDAGAGPAIQDVVAVAADQGVGRAAADDAVVPARTIDGNALHRVGGQQQLGAGVAGEQQPAYAVARGVEALGEHAAGAAGLGTPGDHEAVAQGCHLGYALREIGLRVDGDLRADLAAVGGEKLAAEVDVIAVVGLPYRDKAAAGKRGQVDAIEACGRAGVDAEDAAGDRTALVEALAIQAILAGITGPGHHAAATLQGGDADAEPVAVRKVDRTCAGADPGGVELARVDAAVAALPGGHEAAAGGAGNAGVIVVSGRVGQVHRRGRASRADDDGDYIGTLGHRQARVVAGIAGEGHHIAAAAQGADLGLPVGVDEPA